MHCWLETWTYLSAFSFSDEETHCGENAQGSHQQLHRAAESHSGEGVSQARAQLQAREGWHLGDDCELPEAAAADRPLSERLQPGLLSVLEGPCALPFSWIRGFSRPSAGTPAAARPETPSSPDSQQLLPSLLHTQAHHSAGQREQRPRVEALVEAETETWGVLNSLSLCRKYIFPACSFLMGFLSVSSHWWTSKSTGSHVAEDPAVTLNTYFPFAFKAGGWFWFWVLIVLLFTPVEFYLWTTRCYCICVCHTVFMDSCCGEYFSSVLMYLCQTRCVSMITKRVFCV